MTALENFAVASTKRYLQSIVFVDDEIYNNTSGKPKTLDVEIPEFKSPFSSKHKFPQPEPDKNATGQAEGVESVVIENAETEKLPYHPKELVESFAKEGMVCALYEPAEGFSVDAGSELFRLCERADVVILDWDLYQQDGQNILPLIANLISHGQNSVPHQVRLCAVYTTAPNIEQICSQIFDHMNGKQISMDALSSTSLRAGSSKIVVLGKPTTGRSEQMKAAGEVAERDLATRIITEFAGMHEGILPSMALHHMSSIRMNSKKILDKFHRDMDGPFLLHRALILADEDAFDQIPELVSEEALAVMMDNPVSETTATELASEVAEAVPLDIAWQPFPGRPPQEPGVLAKRWLAGGAMAVADEYKITPKSVKPDVFHAAMGCDQSSDHKRLASLFDVRTSYSSAKGLSFGTIVRRQMEDQTYAYAVCLMPLCDSLRLEQGDKQYTFPFWHLKTVGNGASSRGVVVQIADKSFVELFAFGKPRDNLWLDTFSAGAGGMVVAELANHIPIFTGLASTWEWVGQLKPSHAQRIAQDIGQSLSRVAVVEAEWLRQKAEGR